MIYCYNRNGTGPGAIFLFGMFKFQFIVLLENAVGNAVLSVPKELWGSMPQNSYDFHDLQYKYMPLRGRNAEDSVPYGMPDKLQFTVAIDFLPVS